LDGIDNTGKTWLVNRLKELYPNVGFCAFPSKELCGSQAFKRVAEDRNPENVLTWLGKLYTEEYIVLTRMLENYEQTVIDRCWLSTLLYQGDGPPGFHFESVINNLYERLMGELDVYYGEMIHIICRYSLTSSSGDEENETKRLFDGRQRILYQKLCDLLPRITSRMMSRTFSPYFLNTIEFAEPSLLHCWEQGIEPELDTVKDIQNKRIDAISKMLMDNVSDKEKINTGQ